MAEKQPEKKRGEKKKLEENNIDCMELFAEGQIHTTL